MYYIIYHNADLDGHCSGALAKCALSQVAFSSNIDDATVKLIGLNYGDTIDMNIFTKRDMVWIVDFHLEPYELNLELVLKTKRVTFIDHHVSFLKPALSNDTSFLKESLKDIKLSNVVGDLSNSKAACLLTYEYFKQFYIFNDKTNLGEIVQLLSDYDIWNKEDLFYWENQVLPFQYGIRFYGDTDPSSKSGNIFWEKVFNGLIDIQETITTGSKLLKYEFSKLEKTARENSFEIDFKGYKTIALNTANSGSDCLRGVYNKSKHDIIMTYRNIKNQYWTFGIYSENPDVDCSNIAKTFGGGGHKGASGFQVDDITKVFKGREDWIEVLNAFEEEPILGDNNAIKGNK